MIVIKMDKIRIFLCTSFVVDCIWSGFLARAFKFAKRAQLQNSGPAYANWSDASVGRDSKQQQFFFIILLREKAMSYC